MYGATLIIQYQFTIHWNPPQFSTLYSPNTIKKSQNYKLNTWFSSRSMWCNRRLKFCCFSEKCSFEWKCGFNFIRNWKYNSITQIDNLLQAEVINLQYSPFIWIGKLATIDKSKVQVTLQWVLCIYDDTRTEKWHLKNVFQNRKQMNYMFAMFRMLASQILTHCM